MIKMIKHKNLQAELKVFREAAFSPIAWKHTTRSQARKAGAVTYFSNKACPHGHIERYTITNCCATCQRQRVREKYYGGQ
jgi:hypothetical protein